MKPRLKRHLLTVLLVLTGLNACGMPQPGGDAPDEGGQPLPPAASEHSQSGDEMPEVSSQPVAPAAGESTDVFNCTDSDPHPIGESIAATYETSYEQVMTWFCSGYSFENILIALETGEAVDVPADTLLQMLQEKEWEEIWVEVGFTGDQ